MIIKSLKLSDFGAFRGEHTVELEPREKYHAKRPIILFGGLNGAGKTTILEAVRIALYGRKALGKNVSQQEYDKYLRESIHKAQQLINLDTASVSLEFIHSKLGKVSDYVVTRSWTAAKSQVKEHLVLLRDGQPLSEMSNDQTQSFLNELIPIGVSDLFFFDGEKIKALAEEEGNIALGESIYCLLGLDIIERLRSDLGNYVRRFHVDQSPADIRAKIDEYENVYQKFMVDLKAEQTILDKIQSDILTHQGLLIEKETKFTSQGGAWAVDRSSNQIQRQQLERKMKEIEDEIREELAGLYPLTFAPNLLQDLKLQLEKENKLKQWKAAETIVEERKQACVNAMQKALANTSSQELVKAVDSAFAVLLMPPAGLNETAMMHDVSESEYQQIQAWHQSIQSGHLQDLRQKLEIIERELSDINLQLERTPDVDIVSGLLQEVKTEQEIITTLKRDKQNLMDKIKTSMNRMMDEMRKAKKLEEMLGNSDQENANIQLAAGVRKLLEDFVTKMRQQKVHELETRFEQAFTRLARKEDMLIKAKIDPLTFDVQLIGKHEKVVKKKKLSAGEKQIYAIAMLEALAQTSGKRLPVIIDTPLGRLDSKHRAKLVEHYFPKASHQVIILSTDTEVDSKFYSDLGPHISHAYSINFDEQECASSLTEGYFWKSQKREMAHVS